MINSTAIGYICVAAVIIFGLSQCGSRTDPEETAAVAAACAKVGMAPEVTNRAGHGISMRCVPVPSSAQPAASGVR